MIYLIDPASTCTMSTFS